MTNDTNKHTSSTKESLNNYLLIAMPSLQGSNFSQAVVYLCEHSIEGAMGLVINDPLNIPLSQIFQQLKLDYPAAVGKQPLLSGGPVQVDRGFVLHRAEAKQWESTLSISNDICLTASSDIISDIATEQGPKDLLITLGYAGWGPGQLEEELASNAWLTVPADSSILFDTPFHQRAAAAAARVGIDLTKLSTEVGHA